MRLPAYVVFFYAINCTIIPTGVMDPYMQMMFGTSDEMLPVMQGPVGDFAFMSNAVGNWAFGFMLWPDGKNTYQQDKTQIFGVFILFTLAWIPVLWFMFSNGLMGTIGLMQYGAINGLSLILAVYTFCAMPTR